MALILKGFCQANDEEITLEQHVVDAFFLQ
jgi:hypothetical protein